MIEEVIDLLNAKVKTLAYVVEPYGLTRKTMKVDGKSRKVYPAAIEHDKDCVTAKEILVTPDRKEYSVLWWEVVGTFANTEVNRSLNTMSGTIRLYVWLNTEKINKDNLRSTSYFSDFFAVMPRQLVATQNTHQTFIERVRFNQTDSNFRQYTFDEVFSTRPYVAFSIDIDLMLYVSANCILPVENIDYDQCGEEVS